MPLTTSVRVLVLSATVKLIQLSAFHRPQPPRDPATMLDRWSNDWDLPHLAWERLLALQVLEAKETCQRALIVYCLFPALLAMALCSVFTLQLDAHCLVPPRLKVWTSACSSCPQVLHGEAPSHAGALSSHAAWSGIPSARPRGSADLSATSNLRVLHLCPMAVFSSTSIA